MGGKLNDLDKKRIVEAYVECQNYSEVAKRFNVSDTTVKTIVKKDDESLKKFEQKKEENTKNVLAEMSKRSQKK